MTAFVSIKNLSKTYDNGEQALRGVSLDIAEGEILALLGPNGAGKTTLISTVCGLIAPSSGTITVGGYDVINDYRECRSLIGLVPQEIALEPFEKVFASVSFTRGLFGKPSDPAHIEKVLRQLSIWNKKDTPLNSLSGGMKRRVLIAKALSHEPRVLFLDEPTAGVDVELRKDMWDLIRGLKQQGVTIILTTHYIEEAEAIADRIGVINDGQLLLAESKATLMKRLGRKYLHIELQSTLDAVPAELERYKLERGDDGRSLRYVYDTQDDRTGITALLSDLNGIGIGIRDVQTYQSSLEEIFVDLVKEKS